MCWSTSTRTRITRSTCLSANWSGCGHPGAELPHSEPAELCVVGDADQSITLSAGRRSATSASSSRTILTPGPSCSSRTTAPPRRFSSGPTRSSRATRTGPRRSCGPRAPRATPSSATWPTTSTTKPGSSPARSTGCRMPAGPSPADVAVFYRTNAQSRALEEIMIRSGCPTGSWGRALLRAARDPRRARLSACGGESR